MIKKNRRSLITPQAPLVTDMDALSYIRYRPWADAETKARAFEKEGLPCPVGRRYSRAVYLEECARLEELETDYFNGSGVFIRSPEDWDYFFPEDYGLSARQRKLVRSTAELIRNDQRFTFGRIRDLLGKIRNGDSTTNNELMSARSMLLDFDERVSRYDFDMHMKIGDFSSKEAAFAWNLLYLSVFTERQRLMSDFRDVTEAH